MEWLISLLVGRRKGTDEIELNEYCSISGFKPKEVRRLKAVFLSVAEANEANEFYLTKNGFLGMKCVENNPLAGK